MVPPAGQRAAALCQRHKRLGKRAVANSSLAVNANRRSRLAASTSYPQPSQDQQRPPRPEQQQSAQDLRASANAARLKADDSHEVLQKDSSQGAGDFSSVN